MHPSKIPEPRSDGTRHRQLIAGRWCCRVCPMCEQPLVGVLQARHVYPWSPAYLYWHDGCPTPPPGAVNELRPWPLGETT